MPFAEPEETGGLRHLPANIMGHLLLVWAVEYVPHSPSMYTQPGMPSDLVVVDVVDLDVTDERGFPGVLARKSWWRQNQLIASLKPLIGGKEPVLARMGKGGASAGRNAPYVLISATADQAAVQKATAWLSSNPDFIPSEPRAVVPDAFDEPQGEQPAWSQPMPPTAPPAPQETMLERMARQASQPRPSQVPSPQGQYQYPQGDDPGY